MSKQQQNPFDQKKNSILNEIQSIEPDLSPKGTIDELCLPIIHLINSHKDMVTTSSCSGRISVFLEGSKQYTKKEINLNGSDDNDISINKIGGKGQGGKWLYVSHDQDKVVGWIKKVNEEDNITFQYEDIDKSQKILDNSIRYILYKYEPFILHVKCRDFESASKLYNTAMACGFRESGIGSNHIVAVRINIKLDVPIGYLDEENNDNLTLFVTKRYIEILDNLTVSKFDDNKRKMEELYEKIQNEIINAPVSKSKKDFETKEQRRERKRKEGLERQRQQQNNH